MHCLQNSVFNPQRHPTFSQAFALSQSRIKQMQKLLAPLADSQLDIETIAVSGSLGRLESLAHSDCDLMVILKKTPKSPVHSNTVMQTIWDMLAPLNLPLPKSSGIYAVPSSVEQICDQQTLGLIADDRNIFGQRMQMLLDARSVYKETAFRNLLIGLLKRYASGFLIHNQSKEWLYLINDLIRYLRSYCAWRQFDLSSIPSENWYVRNIKLRSSRIPMFAGLMLLLGECSKEKKDKIGWLNEHLRMTPMQRIQFAYRANNDEGFGTLLDACELFMAYMDKPKIRQELLAYTPTTLDELAIKHPPVYQELHNNSDIIIRELTRFILDRRGDWSDKFFEYLLL